MEHRLRQVRAEPLNYISTAAFGIADMFAVTSLCTPYWLKADNDGKMYVGLLSTCIDIEGRDDGGVCYTPETIQSEWILTNLFIIIGIIGLTIATIANVVSFVRNPLETQTIARFAGLVAIIFFNLAQIIFPSAFGQDQIGGSAFQLPANFEVGLSYGLFFAAHWITVIAELCAAKICRPRWQF